MYGKLNAKNLGVFPIANILRKVHAERVDNEPSNDAVKHSEVNLDIIVKNNGENKRIQKDKAFDIIIKQA